MLTPVSNKIYKIFDNIKNTPHNGSIRCKHFSVAIRNGKVITPVECNYHRTYVFGKKRGTIHAEMNIIKYLINTDRSSGFFKNNNPWIEYNNLHNKKGSLTYSKLNRKLCKTDILVFRISTKGIKNSKPCSECINIMKNLNIRKVYYSTEDGSLVCEKISQISSKHKSQMSRYISSTRLVNTL